VNPQLIRQLEGV